MNAIATQNDIVTITLNGEAQQLPFASTVPDLLRHIQIDPTQTGIAVALNDTVVRRADWHHTDITSGDVVEVITATQGG